ncbi:uncharacterized protein BYT42DRAFT_521781 [Radiomyces spectabilis]|uniref:uncharacterized protein n=1 Tax=Radiomyces spectabilis TaxID=64574 RepID=UPI00221FDA3C|nr:uncharacterized protein BYT42DRAFT_521781 [Radiomyces spectabilis]KAI8368103.1 hypothetical protein BYT42DRAFT_521781 [Radiomyces spectabilis]
MSSFAIRRLTENPFLLTTTILALSSWITAFGGACTLKVLNGAWWVMIYEFGIILGCMTLFLRGSILLHRHAVLTLLASSIPLLTIQIDYVIQYNKPVSIKDSANAYAGGYIGLVVVQYLWVLVFGSDSQSRLGRLAQARTPIHSPDPAYHYNHSKHEPLSENLKKTFVNDGPPQAMVPSSTSQTLMMPATEYPERVKALHAYIANPDDPTELSFAAGEILEVADQTGNWWQARNSQGQTGIVPRNYFLDS